MRFIQRSDLMLIEKFQPINVGVKLIANDKANHSLIHLLFRLNTIKVLPKEELNFMEA
tara:strand:+ start:12066 stop:12239 length:174 start_codon:yes stop_codon:yes gene_type:complete